VDPLAKDYPYVSPYNFVENNPLNMVDPDGMAPTWIPSNPAQMLSKGLSDMVVAVGRFFDMVIGTVKGWFGAGVKPAPGVSVGGEVSISVKGNFESWLSPTWSGGVRTEPIIKYDFRFEPYLRVEGEVPIDKFEFGYEHKINPVTSEISDKQTLGLRGSDLKVSHENLIHLQNLIQKN